LIAEALEGSDEDIARVSWGECKMDSEINHSVPKSDWEKALLVGLVTPMTMGGLILLSNAASERAALVGASLITLSVLGIWTDLKQQLDRIESKLSN
jgi:hypothetical protein